MTEFHYVDPDYGGVMAKELYRLQQEKKLCDTIIHVRDGQIHVHGVVLLASRCHVFENLCLVDTIYRHIHCLMSERLSIVQKLVELLYTGQITCTRLEETNQLRDLCCKLKLYTAARELGSICEMIKHEEVQIAPHAELGTFNKANHTSSGNTPVLTFLKEELPLNQYEPTQKIISPHIPELFQQNVVCQDNSLIPHLPINQTVMPYKSDIPQPNLIQHNDMLNMSTSDRLHTEIDTTCSTLHSGLFSMVNSLQQHLEGSRVHLDTCIVQLDGSKVQLDGSKVQLDGKRIQLDDGRVQLNESRVQLDDSRVQLDDGRVQLDDGRVQLDDSRVQLSGSRIQLDDRRVQLDDSRVQLDDSREQLNGSIAQFDCSTVQLNDRTIQLVQSHKDDNHDNELQQDPETGSKATILDDSKLPIVNSSTSDVARGPSETKEDTSENSTLGDTKYSEIVQADLNMSQSTDEISETAVNLRNDRNDSDSSNNISKDDSRMKEETTVSDSTGKCHGISNDDKESETEEKECNRNTEDNYESFTNMEGKRTSLRLSRRRPCSEKSVKIVRNHVNCDDEGLDDEEGMDDKDDDDDNDDDGDYDRIDDSDSNDSDPDFVYDTTTCSRANTKQRKKQNQKTQKLKKFTSQSNAEHNLNGILGKRTRSRSVRRKSIQIGEKVRPTIKKRGRPRKIITEDTENKKLKLEKKKEKNPKTCKSNSKSVTKKQKMLKSSVFHDNDNNNLSSVRKRKENVKSDKTQKKRRKKDFNSDVKVYRSRGVCYICDDVFGDAQGLKEHYKTSHEAVIQCPKCEETMDVGNLYKHYRQKHISTCETCGYKCTGKRKVEDRFADHKWKAHGEIYSPKRYPVLSCPEEGCNFKSVRKTHITSHRKMVHMPWEHICEICGQASGNATNLRVHIERVHQKLKGDLKFQCQLCPKKFASKGSLHGHMKFHNKELLCHLCSKCCSTKTDLAVHLYTNHDIVSPNLRLRQCPHCDFKHYSSWAFKSHVASKHGGTKDFVCKECGKEFYASKNLYDHMKIHIGKKYQCPVEGCTFTTIYKSALYRCHVPTVHTEKDIKNSMCHLCDYRCKNNHALKTHIRLKHNVNLTGPEIKQIQARLHAPVVEEGTVILPARTNHVLDDLTSQQLETNTVNEHGPIDLLLS